MKQSHHGIQTLIHYLISLHLQDCYVGEWNGLFLPITYRLAKQELSLPMWPYLTKDDVERVASAINKHEL